MIAGMNPFGLSYCPLDARRLLLELRPWELPCRPPPPRWLPLPPRFDCDALLITGFLLCVGRSNVVDEIWTFGIVYCSQHSPSFVCDIRSNARRNSRCKPRHEKSSAVFARFRPRLNGSSTQRRLLVARCQFFPFLDI